MGGISSPSGGAPRALPSLSLAPLKGVDPTPATLVEPDFTICFPLPHHHRTTPSPLNKSVSMETIQ